jgi:hypothetical protein
MAGPRFVYVPLGRKDEATEEFRVTGRRPKRTTVFHESQTDPITEGK